MSRRDFTFSGHYMWADMRIKPALLISSVEVMEHVQVLR